MKRISIIETAKKVGEKVVLAGWVHGRRNHGKVLFIDLRDRSGIIQVVFTPGNKEAYEIANTLGPEYVVQIEGTVSQRPDSMVNAEIATGSVEIQPESISIISKAQTPPLPIDSDGYDISEEVRNKYRYLDLRRERLKKNILLRHQVTTIIREYMNRNGFVEIETPTLTKTAPEGARDFLVPSRFSPGKFYALPQSPQQYKQLLMIAGFEKYYQIAHAFRDEDLRADRQFEHTQVDIEMSFVTEKDVRDMWEEAMIELADKLGKKITKKPFLTFSHEEAMTKFGADKFDMRENKNDPNELAFAWVVDFPLFEKDEESGKLTFAHNPFSAPKKEHVEKLLNGEDLENLRAQQYDLVCNGLEMASGGVRISDPEVQRKVFEIMGLTKEETEERFGHLINAYEYGAPTHAGLAPGLDRLVSILANEPDIREVIAFPVSAHGQTSVMDAPSEISEKQLKELHLQIKK